MTKTKSSGFKKGNAVIETVLMVVFLSAFGMTIFFAYKVFGEVNTQIQADPTFDTTSKNTVNDLYSRYPSTFDGMFVMVFILLWGVMLVASFFIDTHPIFFIFSVLFLISIFVASIYIGNTLETLMSDAELTSLVSSFPKTYFILTHLLETALVVGFSIALVLYGKNRA